MRDMLKKQVDMFDPEKFTVGDAYKIAESKKTNDGETIIETRHGILLDVSYEKIEFAVAVKDSFSNNHMVSNRLRISFLDMDRYDFTKMTTLSDIERVR